MASVFGLECVDASIVPGLVDFLGKDGLEISCGEVHLTCLCADMATSVQATDPKGSKIALAWEHTFEGLRCPVTFQTTDVAFLNTP